MARCFLSCLGTSPYVECLYVAPDGRESPPVRYVQEATIRLFCKDWGKDDRILIFTTQDALQKNWRDNGHGDGQPGLESRLKALSLAASLKQVNIPEGKTIEEIWKIFNILYECLNEKDQVICDITHAFRSLPMLVLAVLGYARTMKQVTSEGIYYGAFEVLGMPAQVRNMPLEQRRAPIFDLTPFAALLDWTTAIDRFLAGGDATLAQELAEREVRPLLRDSRGQDQAAKSIQSIAKSLGEMTEALSTCRGPDLPASIQGVKEALTRCPRPDLIPPFGPLLQRLTEKIQKYEKQSPHVFLMAARWCADHNLIQQGYTILQEGLISYLVEKVINGNSLDLEQRELVNQSLTIMHKGLEECEWYEPARSHSQEIQNLIAFWNKFPELGKIFRDLTQKRNDLNHAAFRESPMSAEKFAPKLKTLLDRMAALLGGPHVP